MKRVLDLSALRSFVAVAECGGVTKAANLLNLTQSAVSMQMKRLEDALEVNLLDRSARSVVPTAAGEQLLGYSRKLLALNDEAVSRLTGNVYEGTLTLGVPHDIVYPHIPWVLQRLNTDFPRIRVQLLSSYTRKLREEFDRGACDIILTTEDSVGDNGESLVQLPLVWVGAPGGAAWRSRPLRLGFEPACLFRAPVQRALDTAGIEWDMAVESDSSRTVEASLSADLAISVALSGTTPPHLENVSHGGALPKLPSRNINLYVGHAGTDTPIAHCAALLRSAFGGAAMRVVA